MLRMARGYVYHSMCVLLWVQQLETLYMLVFTDE